MKTIKMLENEKLLEQFIPYELALIKFGYIIGLQDAGKLDEM